MKEIEEAYDIHWEEVKDCVDSDGHYLPNLKQEDEPCSEQFEDFLISECCIDSIGWIPRKLVKGNYIKLSEKR